MKKVLVLVLAAIFLMSGFTVFADPMDDYQAAMEQEFLSGEIAMEFSVRFNAVPSEKLGITSEDVENLNNSRMNFKIKMNSNADQTKMQMAMNMQIVSPEPSFVEEFADGMEMNAWYDWDFTDQENPKYNVIMQVPGEEQYQYFDYIKLMELSGITVDSFTDLMDTEKAAQMEAVLMEGIDAEKFQPEYKDGKYVITLDEETIKASAKTLMLNMGDFMKSFFTVSLSGDMAKQEQDYVNMITEFFEKLDGVQLFADDAVVLTTELDDQKQLKQQEMEINLKTNLVQIGNAFALDNGDLDEKDADIDLTVSMKISYSKINEEVAIDFPELTENNSVDIIGLMISSIQPVVSVGSDKNKIYITVNGTALQMKEEPYLSDDRTMVPLAEFLNALYPEQVISTTNENGVYQVSCDAIKISASDGALQVTVNGTDVELDAPVAVDGSTVYFPVRVVAEALGFQVGWIDYSESGNYTGGVVELQK